MDKMAKWLILILMAVMMATLANAQLSATLTGVKLKTQTDYLEIGISQNFKLATDITSLVIGNEKRNETYYPYFSFKVVNPNFWVEEVNITDLINCTGGGEDLELSCAELNYTINRSRRIKYTLTFDRDITEEYIEGWDWRNINLGRDWSFNADFKCYFNNSKSKRNIVNYELIDRINTKKNQTDITITFNFSGVEKGSIVTCEDPIYNVKKFYDEFTDLSQWNNDAQNDWKSVSGAACAGVGCTGSTACTAGGSNMSISYDIDLSDCVNGTAYVNWTASEIGTSDVEDCLNRTYSLNGGVTWQNASRVFCDDLAATTAYGFKVSTAEYSSQFRWKFACQNFQAAGEAVQIPMFNITCNATKAVVSNCGNLNTGNVQYDLRKNVNSTGTCFNIIANNVTVDCHGYKINYSSSALSTREDAILVQKVNYTTIRSCNIFEGVADGTEIAIWLNISSNNIIYNNTVITRASSSTTLFLVNSSYNIIYNNVFNMTVKNEPTIRIGAVTIRSNSNNNTFYNNVIYSINQTTLRLGSNFHNNIFSNNTIFSSHIGILLNGSGDEATLLYTPSPNSSSFNSFINNTIICLTCDDTYKGDIIITSNVTDTLFLNNSFNKSRVVFVPRSPENPVEKNNITVKWYLSVNISNSTKTIVGAQYNINDSNAKNIVNESMTSTIKTIEVTEYTQNGSVAWGTSDSCATLNPNITCFSPFNMSANMTGYNSNATSIEMNRSRLVNLFLGIISGGAPPDPCAYVSGDYNLNCADNCVINSDVNVLDNNVNMFGNGIITLFATIFNYNIRTIHTPCQWVCHNANGCWRRE